MFSVLIQISWPLIMSVNLQIATPCHLIFFFFIFASLPPNCTQCLAPYIFVADNESRLLFFVPPCELFRAAIRVTNDFRYASESHNISFNSSHFFCVSFPLLLSTGKLLNQVYRDINIFESWLWLLKLNYAFGWEVVTTVNIRSVFWIIFTELVHR